MGNGKWKFSGGHLDFPRMSSSQACCQWILKGHYIERCSNPLPIVQEIFIFYKIGKTYFVVSNVLPPTTHPPPILFASYSVFFSINFHSFFINFKQKHTHTHTKENEKSPLLCWGYFLLDFSFRFSFLFDNFLSFLEGYKAKDFPLGYIVGGGGRIFL